MQKTLYKPALILMGLGIFIRHRYSLKIDIVESLEHFNEILREADGIVVSRDHWGIDLPPEKVFLFQKAALHKCNLAGKLVVVTRW